MKWRCGNGGLAALGGETARHVAAHATNDRAAIAETPSPLPARAWRASEPVDDTPGARYLVTRRGAWPAGERFPASVRWAAGTGGVALGCIRAAGWCPSPVADRRGRVRGLSVRFPR